MIIIPQRNKFRLPTTMVAQLHNLCESILQCAATSNFHILPVNHSQSPCYPMLYNPYIKQCVFKLRSVDRISCIWDGRAQRWKSRGLEPGVSVLRNGRRDLADAQLVVYRGETWPASGAEKSSWLASRRETSRSHHQVLFIQVLLLWMKS